MGHKENKCCPSQVGWLCCCYPRVRSQGLRNQIAHGLVYLLTRCNLFLKLKLAFNAFTSLSFQRWGGFGVFWMVLEYFEELPSPLLPLHPEDNVIPKLDICMCISPSGWGSALGKMPPSPSIPAAALSAAHKCHQADVASSVCAEWVTSGQSVHRQADLYRRPQTQKRAVFALPPLLSSSSLTPVISELKFWPLCLEVQFSSVLWLCSSKPWICEPVALDPPWETVGNAGSQTPSQISQTKVHPRVCVCVCARTLTWRGQRSEVKVRSLT